MALKRPSPTPLSFWEKLDLVPAGLSIFGAVLYNALTGLFRGKTGAKTYRLHLFRNIIHKMVMRLSLRQATYVTAPTQTTYKNFVAQKKGIQTENTVSLKSGATGHWIGNKNAKNVVVYYHGGGFSLPATEDHFKYSSHLITTMAKTTNQEMAVFLLSYSLLADAIYPTQLTQAVDALHHILTSSTTPRSPSNIFIGGDSAGGNLAVSVLLHLSHPQPEIEAEIPLSGLVTDEEPLGGVYSIAPWVSFRTDCWPSIAKNEYKDLITAAELQKWSAAYTAGAEPGDPWCEPFLAPAEWWEGFRAKGLLVTAGADEILLSCVEAFVEKVREGCAKEEEDVVLKVADGESHVPMAYDGQLDTIQGRELESWLAGRLN